jgi:hypothetical protein
VIDALHLPVPDHHVGAAGHDRFDQPRDVLRAVLVVRVGVDDHVGAELERRVEPSLEGRGQALVGGQPHQVVHTVPASHLDRSVGRPVVHDQPLDPIEPSYLARQLGKQPGEQLLFVETGDLDDQLHPR